MTSSETFSNFYRVTIKFPPFSFGTDQLIGFYSDKGLAKRVYDCAFTYFFRDRKINGGVDIFFDKYFGEVVRTSAGWSPKNSNEVIQTRFDPEKLQTLLNALYASAKAAHDKRRPGYSFEIFVSPPENSHFHRNEETQQKTAHSERKRARSPSPVESNIQSSSDIQKELEKIIGDFQTKQEANKRYHNWAKMHHPDKVPPEEREAANEKFQKMQQLYDLVKETNHW